MTVVSSASQVPAARGRKDQARQPKTPAQKFWGGVREVVIILIIALLLSTGIKTWVMRSFFIPSESMEDTLQVHDHILVNQLPWNHPKRGDIVVFDDPGGWLGQSTIDEYKPNPVLEFIGLVPADAGQQLIKRVIGVGGDHVVCCDEQSRITVNGQPIDETYLSSGIEPSSMAFNVRVPAGHYWVMGDNRSNSADSRYNQESAGGPFVPEDNIVGQAFAINWPSNRMRILRNPSEVFAKVPDTDPGEDPAGGDGDAGGLRDTGKSSSAPTLSDTMATNR
nr:signal peptidase I [Brevibacterium sp. 68QC2CO]